MALILIRFRCEVNCAVQRGVILSIDMGSLELMAAEQRCLQLVFIRFAACAYHCNYILKFILCITFSENNLPFT